MWTLLGLVIILLGAFTVWLWPSKTADEDPWTTVFRTGDAGQIAFIKSLLENAQIPFTVKSEGVQDLFGVGRLGAGYNMVTGPVEVQVPQGYVKEARELLGEMETELGHS